MRSTGHCLYRNQQRVIRALRHSHLAHITLATELGAAVGTSRGRKTTGRPILIVDGSASIRQVLNFILKSTGYEIDEAVDGKEDLDRAQSESYSLVFIDQNMPNMDGLSLIRSLCNLAGHRSMPILVLTIKLSDATKQQGRSAGITGWLAKPFDPSRLFEVTHEVLP